MAAEIPAGRVASLGKQGDGTRFFLRTEIVDFLLVVFERRREEVAHRDRGSAGSAQVEHQPIAGVEGDRGGKERESNPLCPEAHDLPAVGGVGESHAIPGFATSE